MSKSITMVHSKKDLPRFTKKDLPKKYYQGTHAKSIILNKVHNQNHGITSVRMITIFICYMSMYLYQNYAITMLSWCKSEVENVFPHLLACEFLNWLLYDISIFLRLDPAHIHVPQYLHGICPKNMVLP